MEEVKGLFSFLLISGWMAREKNVDSLPRDWTASEFVQRREYDGKGCC